MKSNDLWSATCEANQSIFFSFMQLYKICKLSFANNMFWIYKINVNLKWEKKNLRIWRAKQFFEEIENVPVWKRNPHVIYEEKLRKEKLQKEKWWENPRKIIDKMEKVKQIQKAQQFNLKTQKVNKFWEKGHLKKSTHSQHEIHLWKAIRTPCWSRPLVTFARIYLFH